MSAAPELPVYHRITSGAPASFVIRPFRLRPKYYLVLAIFLISLVSFCTILFLPESTVSVDRVSKVFNDIKRAGPQFLIPPPPRLARHPESDGVNVHLVVDKSKLQAKIDGDASLKVLERPEVLPVAQNLTVPKVSVMNPLVTGGEDKSLETRERRDKVRQMMVHAWTAYEKYAWGSNELRPITKRGHSASIFGSVKFGASIIDAMDTLYIMGLKDEFNRSKQWVINHLDVESMTSEVSVFEVNIRFIGGLLTCYALTGEDVFRQKAKQIADKLLPAFKTKTGIPLAVVNFKTGQARNYAWASMSSSILSEYGTLYLEFYYLSEITGNSIYKQKVDRIVDFLYDKEKPNGLYPNYVDPTSGKWTNHHMSIGSMGDSFYEYLLKAWLQSNKENTKVKKMFEDTMQAMLDQMVFTSNGGLMHFSELRNGKAEHKMEHLACYSGGLLGLASKTLNNDMSKRYLDVGQNVTNTCHESYDRSSTKLGPDGFRFSENAEAKGERSGEQVYILRPEVIESYFYMYRLTKDQKYRDWGWEAVNAIEKYCRIPTGGYSGIKNVYSTNPEKDDVQQSYFLAETLKYLYLLFSDEKLISLDEWVFNSEGHPLPIKDINPYFRGIK